MTMTSKSERPYRCHLDWGVAGAEGAVKRDDIAVVVDTLSFSTSVAVAVERGAVIYPLSDRSRLAQVVSETGGELSVARADVPSKGRYSLSPLTYLDVPPDTTIVLHSANGGRMCEIVGALPFVYMGAIVNARAVADIVTAALNSADRAVTVIAAGERLESTEGDLHMRFAIEDYLGAGAIVSELTVTKSAEAQVCEAAFSQLLPGLEDILWECESGLELRQVGFADDVRFASRLNELNSVPVLRGGRILNAD
jgi:2-phosphosulfolactate phosphatase